MKFSQQIAVLAMIVAVIRVIASMFFYGFNYFSFLIVSTEAIVEVLIAGTILWLIIGGKHD